MRDGGLELPLYLNLGIEIIDTVGDVKSFVLHEVVTRTPACFGIMKSCSAKVSL